MLTDILYNSHPPNYTVAFGHTAAQLTACGLAVRIQHSTGTDRRPIFQRESRTLFDGDAVITPENSYVRNIGIPGRKNAAAPRRETEKTGKGGKRLQFPGPECKKKLQTL